MTQTTPLYVKQVDAARMFGVSDRTLRRWETRKLVKGYRRDGVKLYEVDELKRAVTGGEPVADTISP